MNSTRYEIEWPENCPSDGMGGLDADAIQWGVDWRDTLPKARKCAKDAAKSSPMHLSSPIPSFLVIVHDGSTIRTADTIFGESSLEAYKQNAAGSGFELWIEPLDDVVRKCSAFEPMREALAEMMRGYSNGPERWHRLHGPSESALTLSKKALSLATSNPA